jgi:hypothetical protein
MRFSGYERNEFNERIADGRFVFSGPTLSFCGGTGGTAGTSLCRKDFCGPGKFFSGGTGGTTLIRPRGGVTDKRAKTHVSVTQ